MRTDGSLRQVVSCAKELLQFSTGTEYSPPSIHPVYWVRTVVPHPREPPPSHFQRVAPLGFCGLANNCGDCMPCQPGHGNQRGSLWVRSPKKESSMTSIHITSPSELQLLVELEVENLEILGDVTSLFDNLGSVR